MQVQACGVCHTDLHYREGGINDEFPFLLGHEAAGRGRGRRPGRHRRGAGRLRDPQLAGRVRRVPVVPPGPALVLLRHAQRHAEDDARRRGRCRRRSGIGAFAEKTLVAAGQCTKVSSAVKPEVAGLLGCGVMAGLGAAMHTGEVGPGRLGGRVRLRRRGRRRHRRRALAGAATIIAVDLDARKLELAKEFGATHIGRRVEGGPGGGHPGAHRRQRRRRVHRGRRQPEGVRAGVLRPRPGRHRRAGRRAEPRDAHRPADDRLLRPGRPPQAELVRRLPARAATSRCSSTCTCRAACRSSAS